MKITKTFMALAIALTLGFVSCKPKDADIKANVEKALSTNPDAAGVSVAVDKAVVTLSGEVKDENTKAAVESTAKAAKGVSSVVNNTALPAPAPVVVAPVVVAATSALASAVKDATKDFPTVIANVDSAGVIALSGTIAKAKLQILMPALQSLKPKKVDTKNLKVN